MFARYRERVFRVAYRFVRNRDDALDITQEVFLRVYQRLEGFQTHSKFYTWLYRITVNRSIDFLRRRKGQPLPGLDASRAEPSGRTAPGGPQALAEENELLAILHDEIGKLSQKHREVFILHAFEDLSYKEIAAVVGCNLGTVMSRLFYARKRLQEALAARGIAPPSGSRGCEQP